jgi:hypothetical protein
MLKIFLIVCLSIFSIFSVAHENENRVNLKSKISSTIIAGKVHYTFDLYDNTAKRNLTESDLIDSHEKKVHLFIYDAALKEFKHVHPQFINDEWAVDFDLTVNGQYWVWAQATLLSEGDEFSAFEKINVVNGQIQNEIPATLGEIKTSSDDISVATISGKAKVGSQSMLMVKFSRTDGSTPEMTDYLGAFAHILIVPKDGTAIIHAHPMSTGKPNEGMIHVTFPKEGEYRIWIQYLDAGNLRIVPLSTKVK